MTSRGDGQSRLGPQDSTTPALHLSTRNLTSEQPRSDQPSTAPRLTASASGRVSAGIASGPQSLALSRTPSAANSPWSSRDSSPAGRPARQQGGGPSNRSMSSRKNSQDASPVRSSQIPTSTIPSAAAIQRALSAAAVPQWQPASATEQPSRKTRTQRSNTGNEGTLQWPVSPRLKSPPPSTDPRRSSARKQESAAAAPNIVVQPSTPASSNEDVPAVAESLAKEVASRAASAATKAQSRSGNTLPKLETVQEASLPTAPAFPQETVLSSGESKHSGILSEDDRYVQSPTKSTSKSAKTNSDSDSGERAQSPNPKGPSKDTGSGSTPRPKTISSKTSFSSLKPKSGAEPTENMTVETETVNSVAQATLNAPDRTSAGRAEGGGTLKAKASNDTIRPKKERKKQSRKAPSINAASAATRADKFEAQVLNAMDQASSDDSDETFVYESNPPEPPPHRSRGRHHSRTPSVNSMNSVGEQRGNMRSIATVLDPPKPVQKSRSMKFTTAYSSGDNEDNDLGEGTVRATTSTRGSSSIQHHHLGRQSRKTTNHTSIIDDNNPTFPKLSKQHSNAGVPARGSHNGKLTQNLRSGNSTVKRNGNHYSYDMDDEAADDERAPLLGTVRSSRGGPRTPRAARRYQPSPIYRRSLVSRFAGCVVLIVMLLLLACGVVGFLFAISKPLSDVSILEIQHVLASEQELMFDLVVEATNPNLLPISISDMDVNVFAKSKYVGSEKWWRDHPQLPSSDHVTKRRQGYKKNSTSEGDEVGELQFFDDDKSDPFPDDGTGNKQTMLLGHIYHFDNPLSFDGSFWRQAPHYSSASLRLNKPGNQTELGGTQRWERVIEHPFELIVRGVLKYQIPLGGSKHSASVSSTTAVQPEKGIADPDDDFKIKSARPALRLRFARPEDQRPATESAPHA